MMSRPTPSTSVQILMLGTTATYSRGPIDRCPDYTSGVGGIVEIVVRASDILIYVRSYLRELKNLHESYLIYITDTCSIRGIYAGLRRGWSVCGRRWELKGFLSFGAGGSGGRPEAPRLCPPQGKILRFWSSQMSLLASEARFPWMWESWLNLWFWLFSWFFKNSHITDFHLTSSWRMRETCETNVRQITLSANQLTSFDPHYDSVQSLTVPNRFQMQVSSKFCRKLGV